MKRKPRSLFNARTRGKAHRPTPPPPPPEVERLRDARRVIDPARIYQMQMPDGTTYTTTGAALLETAESMTGVADAISSGDDDTIRRAFDRLAADRDTPTAILCVKVGRLPIAPPPGTMTADCSRCGHAVWISPASHALIGSRGAKPVCSDCTGETGD